MKRRCLSKDDPESWTKISKRNGCPLFELLHQSIKSGKIEEVIRILSQNPTEKYFFNSRLQSAIKTAVKYGQFEIYDQLLSFGARATEHEHISKVWEKFSYWNRMQLRTIHNKHLKETKDDLLALLVSQTRLSHETCENKNPQDVIKYAYEYLIGISSINLILRAAVTESRLKIVFDFNHAAVNLVDPTKNHLVTGMSYFYEGYIYVGAKNLIDGENQAEVIGTLAHELAHYAIQLIYKNNYKPYGRLDEEKKQKFNRIVEECESSKKFESLIEDVFLSYPEEKRHAELIVCVPHLMVLYKTNCRKIDECKKRFSSLFQFYETSLIPDFIKNNNFEGAKCEVKKLNDLNGTLLGLVKSRIKLKPDFLLDFQFSADSFDRVSSNSPKITMAAVYQRLKNETFFESSYIFTSLKGMNDEKIFGLTVKLFALPTHPTIIIDGEGHGKDEIAKILPKLKANGFHERLFIVTEIFNDFNDFDYPCRLIMHSWNQLDINVREDIMKKPISFQGNVVQLRDIFAGQSMNKMEKISLNEVVSDKKLLIRKQIESENIDMRFYIERAFLSQADEYNVELNLNEVMKSCEKEKLILIAGEPGSGKSTILKMIAQTLKADSPARWIGFIEINEFSRQLRQSINNLSTLDLPEIVSFFTEKIFKIENFEAEVFTFLFSIGGVTIFMDGFDEVGSAERNFIQKLLQGIITHTENQIYFTSRCHVTKELKGKINYVSFKLKIFSDNDCREFLKSFWKLKDFDRKFRIIEKVFTTVNSSSSICSFSNPLTVRIIAEIIDDDFADLNEINLFDIYDTLIKKLIVRCMSKGLEAKIALSETFGNDQINKFCVKLAIESTLQSKSIQTMKESLDAFVDKASESAVLHLGLVTSGDDGKLKFVDASFAEFFIARHIFKTFSTFKCDNVKLKDYSKIVVRILTNFSRFKMTRMFLNSLLATQEADSINKSRLFNVPKRLRDQKVLHQLKNLKLIHLLNTLMRLISNSNGIRK